MLAGHDGTRFSAFSVSDAGLYPAVLLMLMLMRDFLTAVEAENPLWEEDAAEWAYWLEEQQTWLNRLGNILQR